MIYFFIKLTDHPFLKILNTKYHDGSHAQSDQNRYAADVGIGTEYKMTQSLSIRFMIEYFKFKTITETCSPAATYCRSMDYMVDGNIVLKYRF